MFHLPTSAYALTTVQFEKLGGIKLKLVMVNQQIDLFAGAYAMQRFENGLRANSIRVDQTAILNLYRFCELNGINLIQRIVDQAPFKIGEIEALSSFCGYTRDTGDPVDPGWYAARMRGARAFISYLWLFYQDRGKRDLESLQTSQLLYERMTAGFKLYAKSPFRPDRKDKIGLTSELQAQFIAIIDPSEDNGLNPWKTSKVRWRNYILLMLLMLGGNRKGETLLLKLNHFQLSGRRKYYDILKTVDVVNYPRMEAPSVKTYGHQVDLHDGLAELIEHYITQVRPQFVGWQQTSYLLISYRDGLPLSLQTPNAMLNELIKKHPQFKGLLSPHRLRNTFHDLLNIALDKKFKHHSPLSRLTLKSPIQEAAGGWTRNSLMPERYAKGSIQAKVAELQVAIQHQAINPEGLINTMGSH
jgi:integrase